MSIAVIEMALRGGAVVLLLLIAAILLRDAHRATAGVFGPLLALGSVAYAISSASIFAGQAPGWVIPLRIIAIGNPVVFWLLSASLFDDDFKPKWWHAGAWVFLVGCGIARPWIGGAPAQWLCIGLALVCNGIGGWYAIAGRATDLVEARRRLRSVLIVAVAIYSVGTILFDVVLPPGGGSPSAYMLNGFGLLAITFAFALTLLTVNPDGALFALPLAEAPRAVAAATVVPGAAQARPGEPRDDDAPLLNALRRLMDTEKVYREEGLSIGSLAAKLGTPEHRLRRLINRHLGYRNFNAFLNGYRLDEVMAALGDPTQEEVPILTIALDAGFQSLGPFNRAFKVQSGMTPSEFRRLQLARIARVAAE
jgi:AraC-like DNA-binding protein